jgi:hypothetical protein
MLNYFFKGNNAFYYYIIYTNIYNNSDNFLNKYGIVIMIGIIFTIT